jgi:hypothetical protein
MDTLAETILNTLENSPEMLLEKALKFDELQKKFDQARKKHNTRCYKYYFENHEEMKAKRKEYAKKYYQQKKEKLKAQEIPSV